MKLYFAPGAASLAPHIVLHEAGCPFTTEQVDLRTHRVASGESLLAIHSKNDVPILELDSGARLTEVSAILQYIADQKPDAALIPGAGTMDRYRVQEWLNFIASELHALFYPLYFRLTTSKDWQDWAERKLADRFDWLSIQLAGSSYLMGRRFGVTDAYLFTVLNWTKLVGIELARWPILNRYFRRVAARPGVQDALKAEGLSVTAAA
jgi:glutathione S-transferase